MLDYNGKRKNLDLWKRLLVFSIYTIILFVTKLYISGSVVPTGGIEDIWLLSAISYLSFSMVLSPYFITPKDSLINSLMTLILLWSLDLNQTTNSAIDMNPIRWIFVVILALISISASIAIISFKPNQKTSMGAESIGNPFYIIATAFGKAEIVYTLPLIISILCFYAAKQFEMSIIIIAWILIVFVKPVENIWLIILKCCYKFGQGSNVVIEGTIQRIDSPNLIRAIIRDAQSWDSSSVKIACLANNSTVYCLPLFYQIQEDSIVGTGLCLCEAEDTNSLPLINSIYKQIGNKKRIDIIAQTYQLTQKADIIGFIAENSNISTIKFEVASDIELQSGQLVFCKIRDEIIYYQILDGQTFEENFNNNPRGSQIVIASQIGLYDEDRFFRKFKWIPHMNSPVFSIKDNKEIFENKSEDCYIELGKIPGSNLPVYANFSDMIYYHTAILGITGTGKTEMALEIIRHAYTHNSKIFCVDFTDEYKKRLFDLTPVTMGFSKEENDELDNLYDKVEAGEYGAGKEKGELTRFIKTIKPAVKIRVDEFLEKTDSNLGIFELPDIANTRTTLRATELFLSCIFEWARKHRKAQNILIVLEEAHTIVPETNLFPYDKGDTQSIIGRMSQIALQGRKYGIGLILISQRTALVSKTLLSQCNTYFTFNLVDRTSLDYLENVYSSDMVKAIPNLPHLNMIAFGKGINSDKPIIVEIPFDPEKKKASESLDSCPKVTDEKQPKEQEEKEVHSETEKDDPS